MVRHSRHSVLLGGFVLHSGLQFLGALLLPTALGFGWWLCKDDPKEPCC